MKTEILTKQDFQPIELKITIETKRELEFFYSIFGASDKRLSNFANDTLNGIANVKLKDFYPCEISTYPLWKQLNDLNIVK